jgi:hypothetical protein
VPGIPISQTRLVALVIEMAGTSPAMTSDATPCQRVLVVAVLSSKVVLSSFDGGT